ncbi:MAG: AI-2E family transporter, partial [Oscillospiraceae bacterium]
MGDKCKGLFTRRVQANILTGIIIALSYVLLQNFSSVRLFLGKFYAIISPIVAGLILAYLLNMIMAPLEKNVLKFVKKSSIKRALSLSLTVIIALVIIAGMLFAIIPQTITSVGSLFVSVQRFLADNKTELMQLAARFNLEEIANIIYGSWNDIFELAKDWGVTALPGVLSATKRVGNGFFNGVMALFIAIYLLADKERLCRHSRIVVRALASDSVYDRTMLAASRSHHIFSGFISGKLLDSLIVGVICFIVMIIFNWPFAVLISVVIGVTNIIPTFGPFIGAIPSMLIIAIENPIQAVYFAIFIFILQQIDGNLLGPLILGDSTGLSAFWVM